MTGLNDNGRHLVADLAERHGFSPEAVTHLLLAIAQGGGTQAQFNHPDFAGMGQWSMGGMIMIGDMFNNGLKARIDALCNDLAGALRDRTVFAPVAPQGQSQSSGGVSLFAAPSSPWPPELGSPASQGSQNDMRYAYFPHSARLAICLGGQVTVYDTGSHQIGGFGQAQSGDQSLTFTSQHGLVRLADLPVVASAAPEVPQEAPDRPREAAPVPFEPPRSPPPSAAPGDVRPTPAPEAEGHPDDRIFMQIERLADLHSRGILTDDEYQAKKTDLLSRL